MREVLLAEAHRVVADHLNRTGIWCTTVVEVEQYNRSTRGRRPGRRVTYCIRVRRLKLIVEARATTVLRSILLLPVLQK